MKLNSRSTALMASLSCALVALTACGGSSGSGGSESASGNSSAPQQNVTLRLAASMVGGNGKALQVVIDGFQKANPAIKVEFDMSPIDTYINVMRVQVRGDGGPDLFYGALGTGALDSVLPLAKDGYLTDLSGQSAVGSLPSGTAELVTYDSKPYMVPAEYEAIGMVYNKDIFAKYNLAVPKTWQEMLSDCKTLTNNGVIPVGLAAATPNVNNTLAMTIANNTVYATDPDWNTKRTDGKVKFTTTDGWTQDLNKIKELQDSQCLDKGAPARGLDQALMALGSGQVAMAPGPIGGISAIQASGSKANLSMFAMPGDTAGGTTLTLSAMKGFAGRKGSAHQTEIKKFLNYVATTDASTQFAHAQGSASTAEFASGNLPPVFADVATLISSKKYAPLYSLTMPGATQTALGKGITGLLTGQTDGKTILQTMDDGWTK